MSSKTLTCIYCTAKNPAGTSRCLACGAPIDQPVTPPTRVTMVNNSSVIPNAVTRADTTPEQIKDALNAAPISNSLKDGLMAAGTGIGALNVGSFVARTAAEAASIAFSSLLVGYFAAATRNFWIGLAGGVLIGVMVGLVVKRPLMVLISAPLGTIAGLVAANFLKSFKPEWPLPLLLSIAGGALLAVLGGRRGTSTGPAKWYTRFRPLLGLMGGFLFALFGYGIGLLAWR